MSGAKWDDKKVNLVTERQVHQHSTGPPAAKIKMLCRLVSLVLSKRTSRWPSCGWLVDPAVDRLSDGGERRRVYDFFSKQPTKLVVFRPKCGASTACTNNRNSGEMRYLREIYYKFHSKCVSRLFIDSYELSFQRIIITLNRYVSHLYLSFENFKTLVTN